MCTQTTLSIARSANAVMFESNVKETYWLLDGSLVTDHFFGFKMVGDNVTVTQDSVVIGFNCGAPPEPAVSVCVCVCVHTSCVAVHLETQGLECLTQKICSVWVNERCLV